MKVKLFDVVMLKDNNKATILNIKKDIYNVDIVDNKGISLGIKEITNNDIKEIIFRKK